MDAPGIGIDEGRQEIGIGRAQLADLPPLQDPGRKQVPLFREIVENRCRGRPGSGLGLAPARQSHLAEQDIAQLLRTAGIERVAGNRLDLRLQGRGLLRKFAGEPRQHCGIDRDAAPLHGGEDRNQGAFKRLVDGHHALGDKARLQQAPEAKAEVGVLRAKRAGTRDLDRREGRLGATLPDNFREIEHRVPEMAMGERREIVLAAAGVEHIGHQHDVVERGEGDAVAVEDQGIRLEVMADLEHAGILEHRLEDGERLVFVHLPGRRTGLGEQVASRPMAQRHVGGLVDPERKRQPDQRGDHRIGRAGDEIDSHQALIGRARDPALERVSVPDRLVAGAVDLLRGSLLLPCARERGRRRHLAAPGRAALAVAFLGRQPERKLASGCCLGRRGSGLGRCRCHGRRRAGGAQGGIGFDRIGIETRRFADALGQAGELHRLEEGDERRRVAPVHRQNFERVLQLDIVVEQDEALRDACLLREIDERPAALLLLDLARRARAAFRGRHTRR